VNRLLARSGSRPAVQARLTVGAAGDRYEQEADRVADQVMSMPGPAVNASPGAQRQEDEALQAKPLAASITPLAQRHAGEEEEIQAEPLAQRQAEEEEEEVQTKPLAQRQAEEEEEEVQTKPSSQLSPADLQAGFEAGSEIESRLAANKGGGSPLPDEVRATMEPRFGADFGGVRLHTGGEAAQLSRDLSAQAFTHGEDIYLGAGQYNPATSQGQRLLAHELTHVVQQGAAQVRRRESDSTDSGAKEPGDGTLPARVDEKADLQREAVLQRKCGKRESHSSPGPRVCHEYVLWRVMVDDMGMSANQASERLTDLRMQHAASGSSIDSDWYGQHIIKTGTQVTETTVRNAAVGDILVLPNVQNPMHSMLVQAQAGDGTYIRGFNNFQTLYTGAYNKDDPEPRNLHGALPALVPNQQLAEGAKPNSYWKPNGQFWKGPLFRVDRTTFRTNLQTALALLPQARNRRCYITTACVEARGLPDDCEELTVLRAFRDDYLLKKANGKQLVGLYYRHAPRIVRAIARQKHASAIYDQLYEVICACVEAIKRGDHEFAYTTYCRMVTSLTKQYIPDVAVPAW
jgi:hypothetical protein